MISQPDCFHIERIDYPQANRFPVESTQGTYTHAAHTTGLRQQVETHHRTQKADLPGTDHFLDLCHFVGHPTPNEYDHIIFGRLLIFENAASILLSV